MTSQYSRGRRLEWAVVNDLRANGYETIRAASSKGCADVAAFKPGQVLLVSCKLTTPPGPVERASLVQVAGYVNAVPLVALGPASNPTYRQLTGTGAGHWVEWFPDEVTA